MPRAKIIIIGQSTVGKSCIALRAKNDEFNENVAPTIGAASLNLTMKNNAGQDIEFNIWDTAGQEKYRSLVPMYFSEAACAFLVYDITNEVSFNVLNEFDSLLAQKTPPNIIKLVIGNKIDLAENREVDKNKAANYTKDIGAIKYFEVSAKTGEGIKDIFEYLANLPELPIEKTEEDDFVELNNMSTQPKQKKCC